MNGKIFLSGGGDEKTSSAIDSIFVNSFKGNKVLYIPVALNRDAAGFEACNLWIHKALDPHTDRNLDIKMVLDLSQISEFDMQTYDAIYIGGGNTYKLLDLIRKSNFDKKIIECLDRGGVFYGGSAGAIIMGSNIQTVEEEKDRDIDTRGLNLLKNCSIRCHVEGNDLELMSRYCERTNETVLGLPEGSGLIYSSGKFTVVGDYIFEITKNSSMKYPKETELYLYSVAR